MQRCQTVQSDRSTAETTRTYRMYNLYKICFTTVKLKVLLIIQCKVPFRNKCTAKKEVERPKLKRERQMKRRNRVRLFPPSPLPPCYNAGLSQDLPPSPRCFVRLLVTMTVGVKNTSQWNGFRSARVRNPAR